MDPLIPNLNPAPDFTLPDLDGFDHSLSALRGRPVVINFWSAECPWAARADQALRPSVESWEESVALLSIAANANEPLVMLRSAAAERDISPVLHDRQRLVADAYGAQTTPHVFIVDAAGLLRYQGAFDDSSFRQPEATRHYLEEAIQALLDGQEPDPAVTLPYGCALVRHRGTQ